MKKIFYGCMLASLINPAFSAIEDNSFLLEEAYNQEYGVFQFIQKYQTPLNKKNTYDYAFENEIPITDKTHQFSYEIPVAKVSPDTKGGIGDVSLNYRWQPLNRDGFLMAERFGLIVPTGSVKDELGGGVYGFEFMQAATLPINENFISHNNFGFSTLPNAKSPGHDQKRTISSFSAGSSIIYLAKDDFNVLFEALIETGQQVDSAGVKSSSTSVTLNPGVRFAFDFDWKDTQIVPGISFPVDVLNAPTEQAVFLYLSIEPKFY